jgi:hypothetical protein
MPLDGSRGPEVPMPQPDVVIVPMMGIGWKYSIIVFAVAGDAALAKVSAMKVASLRSCIVVPLSQDP